MEIYQHDSGVMFLFVLRGELIGSRVGELEQAWSTARSILRGKELVVDVSGVTNADREGVELLSRMRESGARLSPALPREFELVSASTEPRVRQPGHSWRTLFGKVTQTIRAITARTGTTLPHERSGYCRSSAPAPASDGTIGTVGRGMRGRASRRGASAASAVEASMRPNRWPKRYCSKICWRSRPISG